MSKKRSKSSHKRKYKQKKNPKSSQKTAWFNKQFWILLIILVVTIIGFSTSLPNDFVYWDDDRNILENSLVNTFGAYNFWDNTLAIFSTTVIGNYNPLSIFSFALENWIFGIDQPFYWHLNNLILHLVGVFFIFKISKILGLNIWGSAICTILFAIHPMRVESVAWITERKDVLYGALFLAAMYNYILFKIKRKRMNLWWMSLCFILSLFAKIQAVTFPIVMILIDYLLDKEFKWKNIINKWPFFMMSLAVGILGIIVLQDSGSLEANTTYPLWQRIFIGSFSFIVYLAKSIIPYKLVPLYPYPSELLVYFYPTIIIAPVYLGAIFVAWKKGNKILTFGLLFFLVNIVLLLQILAAGQGFLADRFTYIAYFGLFFIIAHYMQSMIATPKWKKLSLATTIIAVLSYTFTTYKQNKVWKNSDTLWSHVLKYNPTSTLAFGNRANYYRDQGFRSKAINDYNASLRINPDQSSTLNSRAKLFFNSNIRDTILLALKDYENAIRLVPDDAEYYVNKGATLGKLGRMSEALEAISKGIELNPSQLSAYLNRSVIYNQFGQFDLALADLETYLKYNPNNADFWFEAGNLKAILGRPQEGLIDINKGIQLNPNKGIYYNRKAEILLSLNRIEEAKSSLLNALNLGYSNIKPELRQRLLSN